MAEVISQLYEEVELQFIAGDALRFKATIMQRDPDDPGPDEAPNMIPYPLDDFTVGSQIRKTFKKDSLLLCTLVVEVDDVDTHVIWVYLPPTESVNLRGVSSAAWDLELVDDNDDPRTIMGGPVTPFGDSTR